MLICFYYIIYNSCFWINSVFQHIFLPTQLTTFTMYFLRKQIFFLAVLFLSLCLDEDTLNVQIMCAWCQKVGVKRYSLSMGSELKSFCSEKCFAACRRAYFKRNKVGNPAFRQLCIFQTLLKGRLVTSYHATT